MYFSLAHFFCDRQRLYKVVYEAIAEYVLRLRRKNFGVSKVPKTLSCHSFNRMRCNQQLTGSLKTHILIYIKPAGLRHPAGGDKKYGFAC